MSNRICESAPVIPPASGGIPLVIGVTGHRDLLPAETALIKDRVRQFYQALRREYPELPLLVMTPLAEGADRIAAEVAHELHIPTMLLLPMPRELYQSDFEGDSLAEFDAFMGLGEVVELPLLEGVSPEAVAHRGRERDRQYAQLGAYLAAHSHILLAIWDGKPSQAPGGTGHVVQFHQHDVSDLLAVGQHRSPIDFSEDESDLVYHVVCSRREDGPPVAALMPGEAYWFTRDDAHPRTLEMPERYRVVFARMSEFSVDMTRPLAGQTPAGLVPEELLSRCSRGVREIAAIYDRADLLARRYQDLAVRAMRVAFAGMVLAGLSFIVYADMPEQQLMIYPYLGFVIAVILVFAVDRRRGWHRKHLDYRMLAEGLRVQFYWALAGVVMDNPSRFSHDSFLKRQDLELGWIRNVMRFAGRSADAGPHDQTAEDVQQVVRYWVDDELGYYGRKAGERRVHHRLTRVLNSAAYVLMLVVALVLALYQWDLVSPWSNVLVALMGLLPLVATLRQNYAHRTLEHELILQYTYTYRLFSNARQLLNLNTDVAVRRDILRALGEAQLDEVSQWLLRQRERPLDSSQLIHG